MPSRTMASRKGYNIIVYNDAEFDALEAVEAFRKLFGYEETQALSCVRLVQLNGSYACKSYTSADMARTVGAYLEDYGFKIKVVYFKKK